MSDQWKGRVITIAGRAVALVDVSITRTLLVDADIFERISSVLENTNGEFGPSGLKEVAEFYRAVERLPEGTRPFISVPWTPADSKKIGLEPFAHILKLFDERAYWRIEGSAEDGFKGFFNFGGIDNEVDLSEAAIPTFQLLLQDTQAQAASAYASGKITKEQQDAIDYFCTGAGRNATACFELYKAHREMLREQDRQEQQRKEKELRDKEKKETGEGSYTGDFPDGWGGDFGDTA